MHWSHNSHFPVNSFLKIERGYARLWNSCPVDHVGTRRPKPSEDVIDAMPTGAKGPQLPNTCMRITFHIASYDGVPISYRWRQLWAFLPCLPGLKRERQSAGRSFGLDSHCFYVLMETLKFSSTSFALLKSHS